MPVLSDPIITELLGSIEANRLMLLCGAGLSLPSPSNLLPAWRVAEICYEKRRDIEVLPDALRHDLDALAGHFHQAGHFKDQFLGLVPWAELLGEPNAGHAAVSDLLVARAAHSTLSANFDPLIETWAKTRKVDLRGALDGAQATEYSAATSPLLKFHGCLERDRDATLWTQRQLDEGAVQQRIQSIKNWLAINLPGKDLLIIGFWTDWGYFNTVLADAVAVGGIGRVLVIDPASTDALQQKAPGLWGHLSAGTHFTHVVGSGDAALQELRTAFSKVWARRFFRLAEPMAPDVPPPDPSGWLGGELYDLRRDAEGVPYNRAAKQSANDPVQQRRTKFITKLEEQKLLLNDPNHVRTVQRWTKVNGERQATNKQQAVRPWWKVDPSGQVVMSIKFGAKPIEFEKGKAGIAVPSKDKLPTVIDTLIAAVRAGELDDLFSQAAKTGSIGKARKAA